MHPLPQYEDSNYQDSNKLKNKIAIITSGDSGTARAVSMAYAIEGANIAITYLNKHQDTKITQKIFKKRVKSVYYFLETSHVLS